LVIANLWAAGWGFANIVPIGVVTLLQAGRQSLRIAPAEAGDELFQLRRVVVEPFE
jgi:hypothetical protein